MLTVIRVTSKYCLSNIKANAKVLPEPQGPIAGPDFAGGGPGANIEHGSSLIIHWSSGSV